MTSWLGVDRRDTSATPEHSIDVLDELARALLKVGWELRLVMGRMLLCEPGDRKARGNDGGLPEGVPAFAGRVDPHKDGGPTRTTLSIERYLRTELRAKAVRREPDPKVEGSDMGRIPESRAPEAGGFEVSAEDSGGLVAVVEFKVGIATSRVIAQVLSYMDAIAAATGKPVLGILVAGGFHKRVVLATRAVSTLRQSKNSFQFSFAAVN